MPYSEDVANVREMRNLRSPSSDKSGLIRSFHRKWADGGIPEDICYSKELAELLEGGIELTMLEATGRPQSSTWQLCHMIAGGDGRVSEFLVAQNADEAVKISESVSSMLITGKFYAKFQKFSSGHWVMPDRCVYYWSGAEEDHLDDNQYAMYRKLETSYSSRFFENRIYEILGEYGG